MTDTHLDATLVTALIVGFGLLARWMLNLHRKNLRLLAENEKLRLARKRTAALIRRCRRDRDNWHDSYQCAVECATEEVAKSAELEAELTAYRAEDERRASVAWRVN